MVLPMMIILGVAEAVLYVSDLNKAADLYSEILGRPLTASFKETRFLQTGKRSTTAKHGRIDIEW